MSDNKQNQEQEQNQPPLALPSTTSTASSESSVPRLDLSKDGGDSVKLDHLGPMVVNTDGTMSRIANWEHMTEMEKQKTMRVLGKRNRQRLEALEAKSVAEGGGGQ